MPSAHCPFTWSYFHFCTQNTFKYPKQVQRCFQFLLTTAHRFHMHLCFLQQVPHRFILWALKPILLRRCCAAYPDSFSVFLNISSLSDVFPVAGPTILGLVTSTATGRIGSPVGCDYSDFLHHLFHINHSTLHGKVRLLSVFRGHLFLSFSFGARP